MSKFWVFGKEAIENKVRKVTTLDGGKKVYNQAEIKVTMVDPNSLRPTAKYVLKGNLAKVEELREDLKKDLGVDIYQDGLAVKGKNGKGRITVAPPIVENGEIVDGIHRVYSARKRGERISVVDIKGASLPHIGEPVEWSEVVECDSPPDKGEDRRRLQNWLPDDPKELRKLYRDFSAFGSTGRRPRKGQNG